MPRGPRPVIPEFPHHIIHRGNNRQQIFYKDRDYFFLIKSIQEAKKEFNCLIYGYCLMSNHIHLIIQPSDLEGLSKMLKLVAGRYTRYINKTYKRTGTLWEGRFKSSPIEQERYLLGCIRYKEGIKRSIPIGSKGFLTRLSKILGRDIVFQPRGRPRKEK